MLKTILGIIMLLSLISCSSKNKIAELGNKNIGMSEESLVSSMGIPDSVYENKNTRVLIYKDSVLVDENIVDCKKYFHITDSNVSRFSYTEKECKK